MNKREAKRTACLIMCSLIQNYLDVGYQDEDIAFKDYLRIADALEQIRDEMDLRGRQNGDTFPISLAEAIKMAGVGTKK